MVPFAAPMARFCERLIRDEPELDARLKPKHLDTSVLDTPALAIANAARETLRMGDAMENHAGRAAKVMHGEPREEKRAAQAGGRYQRAVYRHQALSGADPPGRAGGRGVAPLGGNHRDVA